MLAHLHVLEAVGEVVELLLDDLLGLGHLAALKLLANVFLDLPQLASLAAVDDGDGDARLAGASCAPAAVVVDVVVVGQAVADDVGEVVHVEASSRHVGSHQQLQVALAKLLHHRVALCLRQIAMQGVGVVAVLDELRCHLLGTGASAAKDDAVDARQVVDYALEGEVLVARLDHIVEVAHVGRALVACAGDKLHRVVHVVLCDSGNLARHGGAEEQHLALLGHVAQDLVDVIDEAHVEHLVGLVEDDGAHVVELHHSAPNQVLQSAGSGYYHLHSALHRLDLRLDACSAIHCQHLEPVDVARVVLKVGFCL